MFWIRWIKWYDVWTEGLDTQEEWEVYERTPEKGRWAEKRKSGGYDA